LQGILMQEQAVHRLGNGGKTGEGIQRALSNDWTSFRAFRFNIFWVAGRSTVFGH
jgi:hypothetical protein